jgi:hypothetical protein
MYKSISLLLIGIIISHLGFSQAFLQNLPKDKPLNRLTLYDYRKAFDNYWKPYNVVNGYYKNADGEKQKAANWKQFNRWYHYMESRVNVKTGAFPTTSSAEQYDLWLNNNANSNQGFAAFSSGSWSSVGPSSSGGGYSGTGRLNCVAFHPSDNNTFWVGSPSGGLWKTTNAGSNWTVLTDNNAVLGVSDIAIPSDYATTSTIYIATGDRDGGSMWSLGGGINNDNNSVGVLKSTNSGATWQTTGLSYNTSQKKILSKILVHPTTTSTLYVAGTDGILKSTDAGNTWTNIFNAEVVMDIEFKPGDPTVMYASTMDYNGDIYILVSTNSGTTWTTASTLANTNNRIELAVSSANSAYVYAVVTLRSGALEGIYKSTNSGVSYTQVYDGTLSNHNLLSAYTDGSGTSGQGNYDLALAVSSTDVDEIYVAGVITHKSTDGGATWTAVNCWTSYAAYNKNNAPVVHADHHMLKFRSSDNKLFEVNDGGIYTTANGGSSWSHITGDLVISQLYRLSVGQSAANEVLAGLQDNGTKLFSAASWTDVKGGDGMDCHIDPTNNNTQYGAYVYGQISRTTNHWGSATDIEPSAAGNGWWITPYTIDPNDHNTLYACYADVYKTTDQGNNWAKISTMNTTNAYGTGDLRAIAVAPSNSNYIYVADPNQVWLTSNGGGSWTDITGSLPVASNAITYLTVKDNDPNTVWVTFGNYDAQRIYESTNGGTTWTNISNGLPNIPIMCVVQNKLSTGQTELYVGTDVGVYMKLGTSAWAAYSTSLPNVVVNDLSIYYDNATPSNSRLYAGTSGRGVWKSPLNSVGCTAPLTQASNFGSSNLATTSMTISWTRGNGNRVIVLAHENAAVDSDPASGSSYSANASFGSGDQIGTGNFVVYDGTGTSVNVTSLTSGATIHYALYEYNTVDNCYLTPAFTGDATTLGPPTLTTSSIASITATSASGGGDVSSINGSSLTHKGVCWSISSNPTLANSHTDDIASGTGVGSFSSSITGLSASTLYYVRAYATNASGTAYGDEKTFTTACGAITSFPYVQNFDSWTTSTPAFSCTSDGSIALGDCWENVIGDNIDWDVISGSTASSSTGPTNGYGGSGNYLYTESSSCYGSTGQIITSSFDLTNVANPQLSFYYHMYGADMGTLSVQVSTNGGSTWSSNLWNLSGDQGDSWQLALFSLNAYTSSSNVIIKFIGTTGTNYSSDMAIDEFRIEAGPNCISPSAQYASNITTNDADLNWTENGSATTWEIEYGLSGFTQGSSAGTIITTTSNPYNISGLSGSTSYDWYVRAKCSTIEYSSWSGPSTFITSCGLVTAFPYKESFEGGVAGICWQEVDVTGTDGAWSMRIGTNKPSGASAQDGSKLAYFNSWTSSVGSQTRLFGPELDLSSLNKPMLSFWVYHETGYSSSDDRVQPQVYSSSAWTDIGSSISRYDGTTGWARYTVDLSLYSGTIKIGFLATSDYGNDVHLDNIKVFDSEIVTSGQMRKCSPFFVRNGASGSLYFYDQYTFSVEISDNYDITASWNTGTAFDGYLYLYSPSFDPENPAANLVNSNDDFGTSDYSKLANESLIASTDYVVVTTTKSANDIANTFNVSIEGSSVITANDITDFNGLSKSASHSIATTDGVSRVSDYECDDIDDWTSYYDDNNSPNDYSDDLLLLSVKKNNNALGTTTVSLAGSAGASEIAPSTTFSKYVNSFQGWYVFNRYWVLNPTAEPSSDVQVRFYYKDADFNDLNTALAAAGRATVSDVPDLSVVKINDLNSSNYDPNPANGHNNIPKASAYNTDGAWIYNPPSSPSTVTNAKWTDGSYGSDHYFEFTVSHFSGGGGGAAGTTKDGTLPIELLSFNAFANGDINQVVWKTATELNVEKFIVERMNPSTKKIEEIGTVKAVGNSNVIQSYSFDDTKPLEEAYYRIRNVDYDGASESFDWVFVKRGSTEFKLVNLYPNPATNTAHIEIVNPTGHTIHIELRDMVGKLIFSKDYEAKDGLQTIDLDLSTTSAGTYSLSIDNSIDRIIKMLIIR